MAYCRKCGSYVDDNALKCSVCGREQAQKKQDIAYTAQDAAKNKIFGILAYIGPLFLVPLFVAKNSPFAAFHAKQGRKLFVLLAIYVFVFFMATRVFDGNVLFILLTVPILAGGTFLIPFLTVKGIISASRRRTDKLPFLDKLEKF